VVPDLVVRYHRVEVSIEGQVAQTHIDQVFLNDSPYELEGTYIFPLPEGAAISDFAMFVDGKRLSGKMLDKDEARRIYEGIVQRRRDPAILEYVGRNAFRASIYPIPAHAEKRVQIAYSQVLMAERNLVHYVYPLSTERFSSRPLEEVVITVDLHSDVPIKAIYSPSHKIVVERTGERSALISFEANDLRPDKDFELYYSVSEDDVGLSLLSFKERNEDGFFLLFIAPKLEADQEAIVAKDVVFVLDTSGSMDGEKLQQAQEALQFVLDRLHPEDRFNIVAFATGVQAYATSLRPASERDQASRFVRELAAGGGTDIHRALLEALGMSSGERPQFIIFLTDGLPTAGETDLDDIFADVDDAAGENVRLFTFGVGYDVNTFLLDTISQEHRGASAYVEPGQSIEEEVASFYSKVSTPLLSDLQLQIDGIPTYDLYPYPLPDLFAGSQLLIVGRYRQGGSARVTLQGEVNGEQRTFRFPEAYLDDQGGRDFIPLLWATRKVGYLLKEIRLHGENAELVEEIVALSVRYGIMTPYTSFLVDEGQDILTATGREGLAARSELAAPTAMPFSGAKAVANSQSQNSLVTSDHGGGMASAEIKTVANKAFVLRDGLWTDTTYDPQTMPVVRLPFGSSDYFGLLSNNPECGKYLAVGERLILVLGGEAYQIEPGMVVTAPAPSGLPQLWERLERWWHTIRR
jgi:Ca-activated chloride channel family protein